MRNQQKAGSEQKTRDMLLEEIGTFKGKIQELEDLAGKSGVQVKDLINKAENLANNFSKKITKVKKTLDK